MSGPLDPPNVYRTFQEDAVKVAQMWELEAQNAAREKERGDEGEDRGFKGEDTGCTRNRSRRLCVIVG